MAVWGKTMWLMWSVELGYQLCSSYSSSDCEARKKTSSFFFPKRLLSDQTEFEPTGGIETQFPTNTGLL